MLGRYELLFTVFCTHLEPNLFWVCVSLFGFKMRDRYKGIGSPSDVYPVQALMC